MQKKRKKRAFSFQIYIKRKLFTVNGGGVGENQKTLHLIKVASNLGKLGICELFAVFSKFTRTVRQLFF